MPQNPVLLDDNGNPIGSSSENLLDDNGNPISSSPNLAAPSEQPGALSELYQGAKETVQGLFGMKPEPVHNIEELKNTNLHPMEDSMVQSVKNAGGALSDAAISSGMVPDKMMRGVSPPKYNTLKNLGLAGANIVDLAGIPAAEGLTDAYEGHPARGLGRVAAGGAIAYGLGRAHAPEATKVLETPEPVIKAPELPAKVESTFSPKEGAYILPDKESTATKGSIADVPIKKLYTTAGEYDIKFANDVDKAMWIVSQTNPGPKYAKALDHIVNETGVSRERAVELSKEFNNYVRLEMKGKEPGAHEMPAVYGADTAQEMKVPGINPKTGRENVAMGGASSRVLDVLGSSLYTNDRPTVVTKELLQNALDEHKISGINTPVRVLFSDDSTSPAGEGKSVTIADNGRGLTPEQIYKEFTDVGETGKGNEVSAAGGFGFAKAAPMLSGHYIEVSSVIKSGDHKVRYSFEGNPQELKNQGVGVALNKEIVSNDTPTGLRVTTHFPKEGTSLYRAEDFLKSMVKSSKNLSSKVEFKNTYSNASYYDEWLKTGKHPDYGKPETLEPEPELPYQDTLSLPGADVKLHYNDTSGNEATGYELHVLNKGLFQHSDYGGYGMHPVPNVPERIVADIISKVEEGHKDYPFSANREQINSEVRSAINDWVQKNITEGANAKRIKALQRSYDEMTTMSNTNGYTFPIVDQGGRFTPEDIAKFENSEAWGEGTSTLGEVHNEILDTAKQLGWNTDRLKKFGLLFAPGDAKGTTLGIHIPSPADPKSSAILINLMEHLKASKDNLDSLSTGLFTTVTHEQAHIPGGGHDTGFAYRHARLLETLGRTKTNDILNRLDTAFGDENGRLKPELHELLDIYDESRKREASKDDPLLGTGVNQTRPPDIPGGKGPNGNSNEGGTPKKPSFKRELYELARGASAAWDISAPFNQGFGMIGTREWFKAWKPMVQAFGSEKAFEKSQAQIERLPVVEDGIAHEAGLALMDLSQNLNRREEMLKSTWAEKIPGIRASNRAYTAYLNSLRANSLQRLYDVMPEELKNEPYHVKELASFINDATGRGRHEYGLSKGNLQNIPVIGKMLPDKEVGATVNMERYSKALNDLYFAPRKTSATVRMLNPGTYITLPPMIRNQYLKSLLRMGVAYTVINQLMQGMGGETTSDPTNSDFGKFKFGNGFRVNTPGGFGPFLVLAARIASGRMTSSDSGKTKELGKGFKAWTVKDLAEQFGSNKLHPTLRMAYDLADASGYKPYSVFDRTLQTYTPMVAQDLITILRNDPSLIPGIIPSAVGMGTQYYEKGMNKNVFISPENDIQIKGSPFRAAYDKLTEQ